MKLLAVVLLSFAFSHSAFAVKEVGNGGDTCENRIQIIRSDLRSWMDRGGHKSLTLPQGISARKYKASMSFAISKAAVSCTDKRIIVGGVEKMCRNTRDASNKLSIICNRPAFNNSAKPDQYILIHHEYAGLAGLETNQTEESNYEISNQISSYLTVEQVAKLALKPRPQAKPNRIKDNFGDFTGSYKILSCSEILNEGAKPGDTCSAKFTEIYFAARYYPPANGSEPEASLKLVANHTDELGVPGAMAFLAYETSEDDTICTTSRGVQGCSSELRGFVLTSSLRHQDDKVYFDQTLNWPGSARNYLFRRTSMILEKIEDLK